LPFYDRSKRRNLSQRPLFVTIGAIMVVEFVALTLWGYLTPGQIIPDLQAVLVLGGSAVATVIVIWFIYRVRKARTVSTGAAPLSEKQKIVPKDKTSSKQIRRQIKQANQSMLSWFTAIFVLFLIIASTSLATLVNMLPNLLVTAPFVFLAGVVFIGSTYVLCRMLRGYVLSYEQQRGAQ
jgi:quinol-cytochrome oxidoreductase complex cytochrome b subunit